MAASRLSVGGPRSLLTGGAVRRGASRPSMAAPGAPGAQVQHLTQDMNQMSIGEGRPSVGGGRTSLSARYGGAVVCFIMAGFFDFLGI